MGTKHDVPTDDDLTSYRADLAFREAVEHFVQETPMPADRKETNILGWGGGVRNPLGRHIRSQWLEGGSGGQNYPQT